MMRSLLILLLLVLLYHAVKIVVRSAMRAVRENDGHDLPRRLGGEEMVQDPQCRTYVPRSRAVERTVDGKRFLFCSDGCARQYAGRDRS